MLRVLLLAPLTLAAIGCGDDPLPVLVDVQYQLTREFAGGLVEPARDINNINGVDGLDLTCSVRNDGANQVFSLSAFQGTDFGLSFQNVVFPQGGGGLIGTGCRIGILEGDNMYQGQCSAAAPSGHCVMRPDMTPMYNCMQPCRVFDISITTAADGPTVNLKFFCQGLSYPADRTRVVEVIKPGAGANGTNAQDFPVTLRAVNCDGLAQE
jgi:hypothetical protein